ncbi:MAG: HlyD family secretion protein [Allosphingosinicella sp.]
MLAGLCGFLGWLPLAAGLLDCPATDELMLQGYVEGEYIRVAPAVEGRLMTLMVARGDQVKAGAPLFTLEDTSVAAARAESAASLARAEAELADRRRALRPEEITALEAERDEAAASLRLSAAQLARQEHLVTRGDSPRERLDESRAAHQRDTARLAAIEAQLALARQAGSDEQIRAAAAAVEAANAALAQAEWQLAQTAVAAPESGIVTDTFHEPGEWVAAGVPVVELLPPAKLKVRFFVPEPELAAIRLGAAVGVECDGCPELTAEITYIAPEAEFTPPVIYSQETRAKLVFLVEAHPREDAPAMLHPGQPVTVRIARP